MGTFKIVTPKFCNDFTGEKTKTPKTPKHNNTPVNTTPYLNLIKYNAKFKIDANNAI